MSHADKNLTRMFIKAQAYLRSNIVQMAQSRGSQTFERINA